jgi:hypothetical protein
MSRNQQRRISRTMRVTLAALALLIAGFATIQFAQPAHAASAVVLPADKYVRTNNGYYHTDVSVHYYLSGSTVAATVTADCWVDAYGGLNNYVTYYSLACLALKNGGNQGATNDAYAVGQYQPQRGFYRTIGAYTSGTNANWDIEVRRDLSLICVGYAGVCQIIRFQPGNYVDSHVLT